MRVLIVDDEPEGLSLLGTLLRGEGYEVLEAHHGADALARLKTEGADIIISDVLMPVMDGFRFCREVRADPQWKDVLFVFFTGSYLDDRDKEFGLMLGADQYLRKPIELEALVKILQDLVAAWQEGRLPARQTYARERELLKLYSERLGHKLEQKIQELGRELAERKRVEAKLEELCRKHQLILDAAGEAIIGIDRDGRITFANAAAADITGYIAEELAGRDFHRTLQHTKSDGSSYPAIECPPCNAVRAGIASPIQEELLWRKDGSSFYATCRTAPIVEKGEVKGGVLVVRDVTERRKSEEAKAVMEEQLREAQRLEALATLAGGISHEFNNIIGIILGNAELGWLRLGEDSPSRKGLEQIMQAGYRAKELVKQIGALSRRAEGERHPLQVYLIVKEVFKLLRASLPPTIEMRANLDSKSSIMADPTQIYQVVMNLCTNAVQSMGDIGGALELGLGDVELDETMFHPELPPGPYLLLTVSDARQGTPREATERIVDRSFTAKESDIKTDPGQSVIQRIVASHRGAVAASSGPGEGSTVKVFFPRMETQDLVESRRLDRLATGRERILFVDDEEALVALGQQALGHLGYEVVATGSSIDALKLFQQSPKNFDLIITNQTMPHMTGARLARKALTIRPDVPVILCTGYADAIPQIKALEIGIKDFLVKPLAIDELARCVRRVLDQSRQ
jgi:PAS domain S-box-containing protein